MIDTLIICNKLFHGNSSYVNALQFYVLDILPVL